MLRRNINNIILVVSKCLLSTSLSENRVNTTSFFVQCDIRFPVFFLSSARSLMQQDVSTQFSDTNNLELVGYSVRDIRCGVIICI
jgi:hypothetical protein